MRVVFRKPIVEQLTGMIRAAQRDNLEIKHIELTQEEVRELTRALCFTGKDWERGYDEIDKFMGIQIKTVPNA